MSYLSIEFALAFLLFLALYWGLAPRPHWQKIWLLIASYAFYLSFDMRFAAILAIYSIGIIGFSRWIAHANPSSSPAIKISPLRRPITWALLFAVGNLAVFKYFEFFRESAQQFLQHIGLSLFIPGIDILMPVGISFYTFQSITYLVALHRGERSSAAPLDTLLFLSFFPTLLSGPICRASGPGALLTQLESTQRRHILAPQQALILVLLAVIKKVWLASWLAATWVNPLYTNPGDYHALELLGGLYAYALQIYLDFSGYTDLVTALALLLGYHLPKNFNAPYLARNPREFWQRWHISLSSWIRDYVYIPLGGNQLGWMRTQINLTIAMLLSGLWHGASLNYLAWGGLHALGVVAANIHDKLHPSCTPSSPSALRNGISIFFTFHFVCLAWVFFRADSFDLALVYLEGLTNITSPLRLNIVGLLALMVPGFYLLAHGQRLQSRLEGGLARLPMVWQPVLLASAVALIVAMAPPGIPAFIYYQY